MDGRGKGAPIENLPVTDECGFWTGVNFACHAVARPNACGSQNVDGCRRRLIITPPFAEATCVVPQELIFPDCRRHIASVAEKGIHSISLIRASYRALTCPTCAP
jgi:hypothetical protein